MSVQVLAHFGGTRGRPPFARAWRRFRQTSRDQPCARLVVIPGEDPVVHAEDDVGEGEVFVARRREALEYAAPVVRQVACRAALKGRQPGHRFRSMRLEQRPNGVERVTAHRVPRPVVRPMELDALGSRSLAPDDGDRVGREEGVAAEPRALRRAIEK